MTTVFLKLDSTYCLTRRAAASPPVAGGYFYRQPDGRLIHAQNTHPGIFYCAKRSAIETSIAEVWILRYVNYAHQRRKKRMAQEAVWEFWEE